MEVVDELLHVTARVLLRAYPPLRAHAMMMRVGRLLPQRRAPEEMRLAAARLQKRGTCLSRALAIAARGPSSDVVIGVKPGGDATVDAHAWLELDGEPLNAGDPSGVEIARLRI